MNEVYVLWTLSLESNSRAARRCSGPTGSYKFNSKFVVVDRVCYELQVDVSLSLLGSLLYMYLT